MTSDESTSVDPVQADSRFRQWRATADTTIRDALVLDHRSIAESCARRFADRGEPLDDLVQVALYGLVKSVDRFDPDLGVPFAGFAVPTVMGELRRHFRDTTWMVHVPRGAKDLHVRLPATIDRLTGSLGRAPTARELASELHTSVDQIIDALDAGAAYRALSSDVPETARSAELQATAARSPSDPDARLLVVSLLARLPECERRILWLRFFEGLTQSEIAQKIGTSQVHVSRLINRSLQTLRVVAEGGETETT